MLRYGLHGTGDAMTDLRKAESYTKPGAIVPINIETIQLLVEGLRQSLAQPKYEWVGLTAYEMQELHLNHAHWSEYGCAIEAKLKEKNT